MKEVSKSLYEHFDTKTYEKLIPLVHDGTFTWLSNMCHCTKYSFEEKKERKKKEININIYITKET